MKRTLALAAASALTLGLGVTAATAAPVTHVTSVRPAAVSVAAAHIAIKNFGFTGTFRVKPGQKVIVTNRDSTAHTLTSKARGKFSTGRIPAHATRSFVAPRAVGRYGFHCLYHSEMNGTLRVAR